MTSDKATPSREPDDGSISLAGANPEKEPETMLIVDDEPDSLDYENS